MYTINMYKTVIENSELEEWRSISDAKIFIEQVFQRIKSNYAAERKPYRLSQGNYKNFSNEYIPIFNYLKYKYGLVNNIQFRHVGVGNQPYDGEIKLNNKITKIEIAYPLLGIRSKEFQKRILEKGGATDCYDPEDLFNLIYKLIVYSALKKSKKLYGDTLVLLYYAFSEDLFPGDIGLDEKMFGELVNNLRSIKYKANRVIFFVPEYKYENIYGKQSKTARIYNIKPY